MPVDMGTNLHAFLISQFAKSSRIFADARNPAKRCRFMFRQYDIGSARQLSDVQAIAVTQAVKYPSDAKDKLRTFLEANVGKVLKPGEYILESLKRVPTLGRGISPQLRNEILERNGFTCQVCGSGPTDPDPFNPSRKIRLHIDHVVPLSQGGTNDKENLRVLCSACNQGRSNIQPLTESARNVLARIRRLPRASQKEIYEALKRAFETEKEK